MKDFFQKEKELAETINEEAERICTELIRQNEEKSVYELRAAVLIYLQKNEIPEKVSKSVKTGIDEFINHHIKIPAHKNEQV